jgi:N-acetyl-anhydromuramyl-L-alanine amidase AmpD
MTEVNETFFECYNLFSHINNTMLRDWNRLCTVLNITLHKGASKAKEYRQQLDKESQESLISLFNKLKEQGYESLSREVSRGVV